MSSGNLKSTYYLLWPEVSCTVLNRVCLFFLFLVTSGPCGSTRPLVVALRWTKGEGAPPPALQGAGVPFGPLVVRLLPWAGSRISSGHQLQAGSYQLRIAVCEAVVASLLTHTWRENLGCPLCVAY
jgi:hypothetical protein